MCTSAGYVCTRDYVSAVLSLFFFFFCIRLLLVIIQYICGRKVKPKTNPESSVGEESVALPTQPSPSPSGDERSKEEILKDLFFCYFVCTRLCLI